MKYDFDKVIDRRHTASLKWDAVEKRFGSSDILPLWVADMDFPSPPEVVAALTERAKHGMYGYTIRPQSFYDAILGWLKRRHQWDVRQEWLAFAPGVVTALSVLVSILTEPGERVLIQPPVYYPFFDVVRQNGRELVEQPLVLRDGRYVMDWDDLERKLASGVKLMLLCSPHNPGGRVWSREELQTLGELCRKYQVKVVSDEIHADLVYPGHRHIPLASLSPELAQNTVTCLSPSKTFNLAGIKTAVVVIPHPQLRRKYQERMHLLSLHEENCFAVTALQAAYTQGEGWLEELLAYLQGNLAFLQEFADRHLPGMRVMQPEGTYLVWLDCRSLGMDPQRLKEWMYEEAKVALNEGSMFGQNGRGFLRLNIACPRTLLREGLERMRRAWPK